MARPESSAEPPQATPERRCDYCRLPIPERALTEEFEGVTYHFCSEPCRDRLHEEERVFTEYHGCRRYDPGVSALRAGLPEGIPRNSFVLVSGQPGTRDEALLGELVWRALQRGEPAVVVTFLDTPVSVVQGFVALGWNVLPYLASGQLQILDCFTYRLDDPEDVARSMSDWNRHLYRVANISTTTVRDPTDPQSVLKGVENRLDRVVDEEMASGVVVIDSLTEFGTLVQPVRAYDFVKDLRASVPKARTVPVFASASRLDDGVEFPHDLGYIADGIVDLALSEQLVEDTLVKRIRVRKMNGVRSISRWATYEFAPSQGLVGVSPGGAGDAEGGGAPSDGTRDGDAPGGDGPGAATVDGATGRDDEGGDGGTPEPSGEPGPSNPDEGVVRKNDDGA